jgi:hypothetical protein
VFPPQPPPRTLAEKFVAILLRLGGAVDTKCMFGPLPAPLPVVMLVMARIREIREHVRHLAERIAAGTYKSRRPSAAPRRKPANPRRPRQPSPLPTRFNWLEPLFPEAQPARAALSHLFQDPEMLAAIATAPDALRRPLRSLCWMLGLRPPAVLARPRRPKRLSTPQSAAPAAKAKAPPPAARQKGAPKALSPFGRGLGEGWPQEQNVRRTT